MKDSQIVLIVPISYDDGMALQQAARQAGVTVDAVIDSAIAKVIVAAQAEAATRAPVTVEKTPIASIVS